MLWHETASSAVIVMLTQTHESGKEKCFPYYPEALNNPILSVNEDDEFSDGFRADITLQSINEDAETHSTVRELEMSGVDGRDDEGVCERRSKKVWHLLFSGWPDFSAPEGSDREALIKLVEKSVRLNGNGNEDVDEEEEDAERKDESPRIVHCSAGVGRSGTFIALDYLLTELEDGTFDPVDVASAIKSHSASKSNSGNDISNINTINFNFNKNQANPKVQPAKVDGNNDNNNANGNGNGNDNGNGNGNLSKGSPTQSEDSDIDNSALTGTAAEAADPIADVVDQLRRQRMTMVQNESQFVFLYDVLRQLMTARLEKLIAREQGGR